MQRIASYLTEFAPPFSQRRDASLAFGVIALIAAAWLMVRHPLVGLAVALLPAAILIVLSKPLVFVVGFLVFSFFRIHEVFPQLYSLKIPLLLSLATLTSLGWNLWTGKIKPYWCREFSVFACFFVLVAIGLIMATNRGAAMSAFTGIYIKIAIMVLAIAWLSTTEDAFKLIIRAMLLAGLCVSIVAIKNKMAGIGLVEGTRVTIGRNIGSVLGDPNDLALVLLFPASFALSTLLNKETGKIDTALGYATFIAVLFAIIATQSRGGLLGIISVMGIFAYRRIRSKVLLISIAVVGLSILFAVAGINDRASGGAHEEGIDESAMGRLYAWEAAFGMALSHPLTGVGIDNFLSNYWAYSSHWDGRNHAVHSTWFGVMAETGFLGLGIFLGIIGLTFRRILQTLGTLKARLQIAPISADRTAFALSEATLGGLVGFMVSGTFLTMGFTWPVYVLLALNVALARYVAVTTASNNLQNALQTENARLSQNK